MAWHVKGTYFENCSCDSVCPCTTSGMTRPADTERCRIVLAFHIDDGEVNGVDVSDLNLAMVGDTPQLMVEGNWRVGLFVDGRASQEQADALAGVFSGELGGPMAGLAPLIGEMMGLERAPIQYQDDGTRHSVKVGDAIDIEILDEIHEGMTEPAMLMNIPLPWNTTVTIAQATRSHVNAFGLEFDNTGKNGHAAPFSWAA
jgi:hypothetical protein